MTLETPVLKQPNVNATLIKSDWTKAPLRMAGEFVFHAPPAQVFAMVTDPKVIASWFPTVYDGTTDHDKSCNVGDWGEGTKRYCYTRSMGTLDETILYWDAPNCYAYNIKNWLMPIKDHVGVMTVQEISPGQTRFRWEQYFDFKGLVLRHVFPAMMLKLMNRGMANLAKQLGGPGGKIEAV